MQYTHILGPTDFSPEAPPALHYAIKAATRHQATQLGADLIVMGTHGRTGLQHVLLGSVAEKVVRHASCLVLMVRQRAGSASGREAHGV
jgi:nucleotide-binding universal stress UspA family protein